MIFGFGGMLIVALLLVLLFSSVWIFREYERGVVFFLGRFQKVAGPGLVLIIPAIQQVVRVDLRTVVLEVPTQDVISRDNVSVKVSAVIYFRIVDAKNAVVEVAQYLNATSQLAQTTLRSVLGKHQLDEMLAERDEAERERRAKVIHAEGELQASEKLAQAAAVLAREPQAIQLRYLETLTVIGADKNTTVIFPLPMDLISAFLNRKPG
jgi:regulator of protease activity HflC (stomatin/prohibitin superfamily)